ncbi:MAG: MFS transporter [Acidobacteriota bacterium]
MDGKPRVLRQVGNLLFAQVASQMGDAAFGVLLLWSVLEMTSSKLVVGAVATLNYLPVLLFGMLGGLAADRLPRRGVMVLADAVRAAVAFALPILAMRGLLDPWLLAVAGFLLFTASAFFNPARDAAIPALVGADELVSANAVIQTSVPLGWLLGPAFCSLFLRWYPPQTLFAMVGVLFLISVAFLARLPRLPASARAGASTSSELLGGLRVAGRDVVMRWLLVITAVDNLLIMGPAVVGVPLLVKEVLGGGGREYALLEAALAVGVLAGLPLAAWLNRRFGQGKILIAGIFLDGITYLPLLWLRSVTAVAVVIAFHGLAIPMITVTRASLVQRIIPPEHLGRVFALIGMTVVGLTAVSAGLTGVAATLAPVNVIFGVIAVGASLCGPLAWMSRAFREA